MRTREVVVALLLCLGLVGCAASAPKFNTAGVDKGITPASPTSEIMAVQGRRVQWGGSVVGTTNLRDQTRIEVLGYPLDGSGRPDTEQAAQRRFLVLYNGYLESVDYAPGRRLTVVGSIVEAREGQVGGAPYLYPVVAAGQIYLWPQEPYYRYSQPAFHFGIGVGFGL